MNDIYAFEPSEIPSGWNIKPLKTVINFSKGLPITKENLREAGVACLNYGEIHSKYPFEVKPESDHLPFVSEDYLATNIKSLAYPGDIVFADTSEDVEGAGNFTQILGEEAIFAGYHTVITRPSNIVKARFLAYILESEEFRNQIRSRIKGVKVYSITKGILGNTRVWFPDKKSQALISSYLDTQTTRIDALITEKQRFIDLLKEKRQALISHYVTKGLDPNVPMKDSGVEWIGDVPEHWLLTKLRYLGTCQNGINISGDSFGSGFPFVSYGDVYKNRVLPITGSGLVQSSDSDRGKYTVNKGDVFFTRTSETADEIGFSSVCFLDIKDAVFAGFLIRFRPLNNLLIPEYSRFVFQNQKLRQFFTKEMNVVTRASLSQELLKKMPVPLPSLEEQRKIAEFISSKDMAFQQLINESELSIKLLKEHRTALISAAVTGKIDLRGQATQQGATP